ALHISSRGGIFSEGPAKEFDLDDKYIRAILGFFGVHQIESLFLEKTGILQGTALTEAIEQAHRTARDLATNF
ncbi:MAG TPA: FMN-dependent NADH-azoreductase, partial [Desulfosporosinus sp.]|nr:FMN-dependent NADH-azoreductase [Desulfosporosinus sp.]